VGASEAEGVSVAIEGEGATRLPRSADNVVARGVKLAYEAAGRRFTGCALECTNRVPAARGLGSSAAAWVGGLVAGNALLGSPLTKDALLALAARAEGHPDNVAAALFGGLTVSSASGPTVTAVSLPVPAGLRWVALIPEVTSATAQARAVLPASVPYHDAAFNVPRVALLLASLWAGRPAALAAGLEDGPHGVPAAREHAGAVRAAGIRAGRPLAHDQYQPARLGLRLGPSAYQLRASFLPFRQAVQSRLEERDLSDSDLVIDRLSLDSGATLQRGSVYLVPLLESLHLPPHVRGRSNPKSTTGRLDIFTRVITDE